MHHVQLLAGADATLYQDIRPCDPTLCKRATQRHCTEYLISISRWSWANQDPSQDTKLRCQTATQERRTSCNPYQTLPTAMTIFGISPRSNWSFLRSRHALKNIIALLEDILPYWRLPRLKIHQDSEGFQFPE